MPKPEQIQKELWLEQSNQRNNTTCPSCGGIMRYEETIDGVEDCFWCPACGMDKQLLAWDIFRIQARYLPNESNPFQLVSDL